jgi:hypothetical protein
VGPIGARGFRAVDPDCARQMRPARRSSEAPCAGPADKTAFWIAVESLHQIEI